MRTPIGLKGTTCLPWKSQGVSNPNLEAAFARTNALRRKAARPGYGQGPIKNPTSSERPCIHTMEAVPPFAAPPLSRVLVGNGHISEQELDGGDNGMATKAAATRRRLWNYSHSELLEDISKPPQSMWTARSDWTAYENA